MQEEDIWEGCSHEEFETLCASLPSSVATPVLPHVKEVNFAGILQKYYQLYDHHIAQKVVREWKDKKVELKFSNTGTWTLFFDAHEIDRAWDILSESYLTGNLPGASE
jgi:hypothetical protein